MDFPAWLAARESYDHAARHEPFVGRFAAALPAGAPRVLDLATGRGSNLRYLRPRLPAACRWTVLDRDPALLALVGEADCVRVEHDLRTGLDGLPPADGVVCSALLDLVDQGFLVALADHLVQQALPLLVTLTVDGRLAWERPDPEDEAVHALFRAHQLTDRGFGPSVGVGAAPRLAELLEARGHAVSLARADWELPGSDGPFVAEMLRGIAEAAAEVAPRPEVVTAWTERRAALGGGLTVGHLDLLALPPQGSRVPQPPPSAR